MEDAEDSLESENGIRILGNYYHASSVVQARIRELETKLNDIEDQCDMLAEDKQTLEAENARLREAIVNINNTLTEEYDTPYFVISRIANIVAHALAERGGE